MKGNKMNTKSSRRRIGKEVRQAQAVLISNAIESERQKQQAKQKLKAEEGTNKSVIKELKTKKISIRLTENQYQLIAKQCKNSKGEQLITITDFIRQAALTKKNTIIAQEAPLDRFKLAVASEIATGITEIVHFIDAGLDQRAGNYEMNDCLEIIDRLESLEEIASYLLIPTATETKNNTKQVS